MPGFLLSDFYLGFTALSRIFHLCRASNRLFDSVSKLDASKEPLPLPNSDRLPVNIRF